MSIPEDLSQKIEQTRITYPEREHGVTIRGSPFVCEFDTPVDPETFCDTVSTAEKPWNMFGLPSQLAEDYWKVVGNLYHMEDGDRTDSSKIAFEVAPEWVRIYVKEDCSAARVAKFVNALDEKYGVTVEFADQD